MSKHTPFPWQAVFLSEQGWSVIGPNNELVAVLGQDDTECDDPLEQDAKLLAAAPLLLAALKAMATKATKQNWNDAYPDELAAAFDAIDKAEGAS